MSKQPKVTFKDYCLDVSDDDWVELTLKITWGFNNEPGSMSHGPHIEAVEAWDKETDLEYDFPKEEWKMIHYEIH